MDESKVFHVFSCAESNALVKMMKSRFRDAIMTSFIMVNHAQTMT